jgi:hypothetical protein
MREALAVSPGGQTCWSVPFRTVCLFARLPPAKASFWQNTGWLDAPDH